MNDRFSLSYSNLKGRTKSLVLGPVNVVVGSNFAGKSTILTALRLALLGYDPSLGRTNQATWQLSSGPAMSVALSGKDQTISREWKSQRGSVQCIGKTGSVVPDLLIDVRAFFGKTVKERSAYIMGLVPIPDAMVSGPEMHKAIGEIGAAEDVREFVDFWIEDRRERETPAGQWLTDMIASAEVRAKDAKAEASEAEATVRRFIGEDGPDPRDVSGEIQATRDQLSEIEAVEKAAAIYRSNTDARERSIAEVRRCESVLNNARVAAVAARCDITKEQAESAQRQCQEANSDLVVFGREQARVIEQLRKMESSSKCPTCGCTPKKSLVPKLQKQLLAITKSKAAAMETSNWKGVICERYAASILAANALAEAEKSLRTAMDRLAQYPAMPAVTSPAEGMALRVKLRNLEAEQSRFVARQERAKMLAQAETDATAKRAEAERWVALTKALAGVRDNAVAAAFDGFAAKVRRFTDGILPFELRVRGGEVGCFRGGIWVSHEVLSGSEMALVYAGLAVALAESAPIRIVMVDEVLLSPETKRKVAERMAELASAGVIDAFVCVDVSKDGWPDSVNFIEV